MKNIKTYDIFENKIIVDSRESLPKDVINWLDLYTPNTDWNMLSDGLIHIDGDFDSDENAYPGGKFPVSFGVVNGNFDCSNNELETLKGAPTKILKDFSCSFNNLSTLEGGPEIVGGTYLCKRNKLISLLGAPERTGSGFFCHVNSLRNLEHCPQIINGDFDCSSQGIGLKSLVGGPIEVGGDYYAEYNRLTSLEGIAKKITGNISLNNNQIRSLKYLPDELPGDSTVSFKDNPLPDKIMSLIFYEATSPLPHKLLMVSRFEQAVRFLFKSKLITLDQIAELEDIDLAFFNIKKETKKGFNLVKRIGGFNPKED